MLPSFQHGQQKSSLSRPLNDAAFFCDEGFLQRSGWCLFCAVAWVALEMVRGRLLTGFPWNFLGASQYTFLPLIQIAEFTGIYGISFLVVWCSVAGFLAVISVIRHPARPWRWLADLALPLGVSTIVCSIGWTQVREHEQGRSSLRVSLIQPAFLQTLIWDDKEDSNRFNVLEKLVTSALKTQPELMIWPESAIPGLLDPVLDPETHHRVIQLLREKNVKVICASDEIVISGSNPETKKTEYDVYNSSYLIDSESGLSDRTYRKQRLVPFGEYIPLNNVLPFLGWFTPVQYGFTAGVSPVEFEIPDLGLKTSVLLCYEDNFPHGVRSHVGPETDFLINLTNDGWFGESAAQWQHAANAVFRTVENRVPLVRCTNNGLTCWISAAGRLHSVFSSVPDRIYDRGFYTADLPLLSKKDGALTSFYNRHGDVFGWSCLLGVSVLLFGKRSNQ
jgi:apolipoprotein N-acyltransferase